MCTLCTLYYAYTDCILAFHFLRPSFVTPANLAYAQAYTHTHTHAHTHTVYYTYEYVRSSACAQCIEILNWSFGNRLLRERFPESVDGMSLSYLGEISLTFILLYSSPHVSSIVISRITEKGSWLFFFYLRFRSKDLVKFDELYNCIWSNLWTYNKISDRFYVLIMNYIFFIISTRWSCESFYS